VRRNGTLAIRKLSRPPDGAFQTCPSICYGITLVRDNDKKYPGRFFVGSERRIISASWRRRSSHFSPVSSEEKSSVYDAVTKVRESNPILGRREITYNAGIPPECPVICRKCALRTRQRTPARIGGASCE